MNITEALDKVGNAHCYQKTVLAFLCVFAIIFTYILIGPSYVFINPTFICTSTGERVLQQEQACPIIDQCTMVDAYSITAHVKLYCDRQSQRNLIQSMIFVGSIFGLVLMNLVSDRFGRRFSYLISLYLCLLGAIIVTVGSIAMNSPMIMVGQFLSGFGSCSCYTLALVLISDFSGEVFRQHGIIALNASWALGEVSYILIYHYVKHWQHFMVLGIILPLAILFVLANLLLVQSPVYLIEKSTVEKCVDSLNVIARWNGRDGLSARDVHLDQENRESISFLEVFQEWKWIRLILLLGFFKNVDKMSYSGAQYSMESIGFSFGVNMLITGCLQFVAFMTLNLFVERIQRKIPLIIVTAITSISCLLYVFPAVQASKVIQVIIFGSGRLLMTYGFGLLSLLVNESFDDRVKSSGTGMIEASSYFGTALTPFIVSFCHHIHIHPLTAFGFFLLTGIVPLLFVKETRPNNHPPEQAKLANSPEL